MAGIGTVRADDPMLTARPAGMRTPLRVVVDPTALTPLDSKLVATAGEFPTAIAVQPTNANSENCDALRSAGCQIIELPEGDHTATLEQLLRVLGDRDCTNVLIEGGGAIFGALNDGRLIDEVHCFVAPRVFGGTQASGPVAGSGFEQISDAGELSVIHSQSLGDDFYTISRFRQS